MSVILSNNGRSRELFNLQETSRGKLVKDVIVENDALQITCFVAAIEANENLSIIIEQVGNNSENIKLINRLPIINKPSEEPYTDTFNIGGPVRITVEFTGSVTFDMTARAVSGSVAAIDRVQNVALSLTQDDKIYRQEHINSLCKIVELLETILNHQRYITNLNKDKGDKY
jgi:hypothetical protein